MHKLVQLCLDWHKQGRDEPMLTLSLELSPPSIVAIDVAASEACILASSSPQTDDVKNRQNNYDPQAPRLSGSFLSLLHCIMGWFCSAHEVAFLGSGKASSQPRMPNELSNKTHWTLDLAYFTSCHFLTTANENNFFGKAWGFEGLLLMASSLLILTKQAIWIIRVRT